MNHANEQEVNDFARFIFNTATEDVKSTLASVGRKVKDQQIMRLYDTYCSGYLFLFTIAALGKYGEAVTDQIDETFIDLSKLLMIPSSHLAVGSIFTKRYIMLRDEWMNEDPLSNPILYTSNLVNDEFQIQSIDTVSECYSRFQNKLDKAFNAS